MTSGALPSKFPPVIQRIIKTIPRQRPKVVHLAKNPIATALNLPYLVIVDDGNRIITTFGRLDYRIKQT